MSKSCFLPCIFLVATLRLAMLLCDHFDVSLAFRYPHRDRTALSQRRLLNKLDQIRARGKGFKIL